MKCNERGLGIVLGLALVALLLSASESLAKAITLKSSGTGTFVTANFSYDGVNPASYNTGSGKDNLGGQFTFQEVNEFGPATATTCTAPDGTAGLQYNLVASNGVATYNTGQVYSSAVASSSNHSCISNTTGSIGGTVTHTVDGGTGKFAAAAGTSTATVTGNILAAPGTPPGAGGLFGAFKFTSTGSVTK